MRKIGFVIAFIAISSMGLFAQSPVGKGGKQLNAGVGLSEWGIPVYVGLDFGVHQDITVGIEGSFRSYKDDWHNNHYRHTIFGFSGNGNYHFNRILNIPKAWDFYAGLNLGFYLWHSSPDDYDRDYSPLGLSAQIGGRYYFNNNFGLNLEFGGGNAFSGGKFGISYKF
jgi:outer membrane immunogenic protein